MVKTMRRVSKARKPSTSSTRGASRPSMLHDSTSSFSPINAKPTDDGEDVDAAESEDLPTLEEDLSQGKASERVSDVAVEASSSTSMGKSQGGDAEKFEDTMHADEGRKGNEDDADQGDLVNGEENEVWQNLDEAEESIEVHVNDQNEEEASEGVDGHSSSDIEDSTIAPQDSPASSRPAKGNGKRVSFWDDHKNTERLLSLIEQFAMREHYVNPKTGGWRNGVFRDIGRQIGIDSKHCNNRFTKLKYKYVEILELLNLGAGLAWDDKENEVIGSSSAWSKVKTPKLKKHKGQKFLYKEEFDILNGVLNFVPPPEVGESSEKNSAGGGPPKARGSHPKSSSMAVEYWKNDQGGRDEREISNGDEDGAPSGVEGDPKGDKEPRDASKEETSFIFSSSAAVAKQSSVNRRCLDERSFDDVSMQELVRLLVKYVEDDYYINPVTKTWRHGVFHKISEKMGKTQSLCSFKYSTLKEKYVNMERLLEMNMGFRLNDEKNEVVGSNGAWAQVKDPDLLRCRRSKFLFWKEFAKLAEKLSFVCLPQAPGTGNKRTRGSERITRARRFPSYVDVFSDEEGESHDACNESDSETDTGHESDEEPLRKKRILSDTYEKRREAFYLATSDMCAKREGLKAIVDAQLAIQREHVAIHNAQIMALHRQLKIETQLSRSLQKCQIEDKQRRDDLEHWRGLAQRKLQHERFLTPRGKLRFMQTLQSLTSRTDGYLGVMFLELMLRKLWCKMELEKDVNAQLSDYFIEDEKNAYCKEDASATFHGLAGDSALAELDSDDESVISMRGSSESRDINVKESTGEGSASSVTAVSISSGKQRAGSDRLKNGAQVDDTENQSPGHILNERASNNEWSTRTENEVTSGRNDQPEGIEINPHTSIEDDQIGDVLEDSGREAAHNFQNEEELNQAFREIESEIVIHLGSDTAVKIPFSQGV